MGFLIFFDLRLMAGFGGPTFKFILCFSNMPAVVRSNAKRVQYYDVRFLIMGNFLICQVKREKKGGDTDAN